VSVTVYDALSDELFEIDAEPSAALDVFHHPYAHAARRGCLLAVPAGAAA
jgi:hypothetical protein